MHKKAHGEPTVHQMIWLMVNMSILVLEIFSQSTGLRIQTKLTWLKNLFNLNLQLFRNKQKNHMYSNGVRSISLLNQSETSKQETYQKENEKINIASGII